MDDLNPTQPNPVSSDQQAVWVPTQPGAAQQVPGQPGVPVQVKSKSLPWWAWALIGCGGFVFVFLAFIIIVIVAINPVGRINEAQVRMNQSLVREVSAAVNECITAEKAKGLEAVKIYSEEVCANSDYLSQNKYSAELIPTQVLIESNVGNNKICVYTLGFISEDDKSSKSSIVSWDSDSQVITQPNEGNEGCS